MISAVEALSVDNSGVPQDMNMQNLVMNQQGLQSQGLSNSSMNQSNSSLNGLNGSMSNSMSSSMNGSMNNNMNNSMSSNMNNNMSNNMNNAMNNAMNSAMNGGIQSMNSQSLQGHQMNNQNMMVSNMNGLNLNIPMNMPLNMQMMSMIASNNSAKIKPRRSFTAGEKLSILAEVKEFGFNVTQRKYKIQGTQISKWRKKQDELKKLTEKSSSASRVITVSNEARFPDLERFVYRQYSELVGQVNRVTNSQIQNLAKQAASSSEMREIYGDDVKNAKFGQVWLTSFKRRFNISHQGSQLPHNSVHHHHQQQHQHQHQHQHQLPHQHSVSLLAHPMMTNNGSSANASAKNSNPTSSNSSNVSNQSTGGIPTMITLNNGQTNAQGIPIGIPMNMGNMGLNMAMGIPTAMLPVNISTIGMGNMSMSSLGMNSNSAASMSNNMNNNTMAGGNIPGNMGIPVNGNGIPIGQIIPMNIAMSRGLGIPMTMEMINSQGHMTLQQLNQSPGHILIDGPIPLEFHGNIEGAYLSDGSEDDDLSTSGNKSGAV